MCVCVCLCMSSTFVLVHLDSRLYTVNVVNFCEVIDFLKADRIKKKSVVLSDTSSLVVCD